MRLIRVLYTALACILLASFAVAQTQPPSQPPAQTPSTPPLSAAKTSVVRTADVDSLDHIVAALYDVISGTAGQKRDWDRFRALFAPGARLIPVSPRKEGGYDARFLTREEYITRVEPFFEKEPFYESELARHTDRYGQIVQLFSTYESRRAKVEKPFARGINSIQLINDGTRWWVVTVMWEAERPDNPIPAQYLK